MAFTYTSTELADIAVRIPSLASEAGLLFVPDVRVEGELHLALSGRDLDAEGVIQVAAKVGAAFISVNAVPFDLQGLLDELVDNQDELSNLPNACSKLPASTTASTRA